MKRGEIQQAWLVDCYRRDCPSKVYQTGDVGSLERLLRSRGWTYSMYYGWSCPNCSKEVIDKNNK